MMARKKKKKKVDKLDAMFANGCPFDDEHMVSLQKGRIRFFKIKKFVLQDYIAYLWDKASIRRPILILPFIVTVTFTSLGPLAVMLLMIGVPAYVFYGLLKEFTWRHSFKKSNTTEIKHNSDFDFGKNTTAFGLLTTLTSSTWDDARLQIIDYMDKQEKLNSLLKLQKDAKNAEQWLDKSFHIMLAKVTADVEESKKKVEEYYRKYTTNTVVNELGKILEADEIDTMIYSQIKKKEQLS